MDILGALSEGKRGAIARSSEVARYVVDNPAELGSLIDAVSSADPVVVSHASHALQTVGKAAPELLKDHTHVLLGTLLAGDQWEMIEMVSKILPGLSLRHADKVEIVERLEYLFANSKSSIGRTCSLQAIVDIAATDDQFEANAVAALKSALETGTKAMQARARNLMSK